MNRNDFEKVLSVLETIYKKKYDNLIKEVIYKLALKEQLTLKGFEELILMVVRYNKKYSNDLPLPADIFRYLDEKSTNGNDILRLNNIKNQIRNNILSSNEALVFEDPLVHLAIETIGGFKRLGVLSDEKVEDIITFEINEKLYSSLKENKTFNIPIFVGNPNSRYIRTIGDIEKIKEWTSKIRKAISTFSEETNKLIESSTFKSNNSIIRLGEYKKSSDLQINKIKNDLERLDRALERLSNNEYNFN